MFQRAVEDVELLLLPIFYVLRKTSGTQLGRVIASNVDCVLVCLSGRAVRPTAPRAIGADAKGARAEEVRRLRWATVRVDPGHHGYPLREVEFNHPFLVFSHAESVSRRSRCRGPIAFSQGIQLR